ncbi:valine--tRNA ligase [soil metagenome]
MSERSEEPAKAYCPAEVEAKWFARWVAEGCFRGDETSGAEAYSMVIPPPNVTGVLHLGHVLNNTIQDILARRARQEGKAVLWLPGTDHAGIATQAVVERELRKVGVSRHDLGREAFTAKIWEWKEKHGGIIIQQLKALGCSCDWDRERFTMDAGYSRAVADVFVRLFHKGLIYRGRRMVNWCPASLTALSDEEVIPTPQKAKLYYVRYAVAEEPGRHVEIATTRPETLMGDTGVAVNPKDPRYQDLLGKHAVRPFPEARIPFVADEHIDMAFGTGVLKVTPAHDRADYDIGQRHRLPARDILHPDGRINCPEVPELDGLDRFEARERAAAMLDSMGLLVRAEDYENTVGFSERGRVPIEPRLSMQWFLRYPAVGESTRAVAERDITLRPERWEKTYLHWLENIQDWCISRQLWWGHQIPVYYRAEKAAELQETALDTSHSEGGDIYVGTDAPGGEGWVQDPDVLDTWFSSWLWPFATMDEKTRAKFYPTTDLVTGPDIIFFWVARMIMAGYEFTGQKPFANVFFTSIIRDLQGRKMSKSLGNSPDPLDLIAQYGADALRFGLLRIAPAGTDVKFDEKQVAEGRNFATKLWNAARYRQMQAGAPDDSDGLTIYADDILTKLHKLESDFADSLAAYRFNDAAQHLYDFFWSNYCDWYLESIKSDFRAGADPARTASTLWVIDTVLRRFLPLLHVYMPHITEELWEILGFAGPEGTPLMVTPLSTGARPSPGGGGIPGRAEAVYGAVRKLRNLKAEYHLASNKSVTFTLVPAAGWVGAEAATLALLAGAGAVTVDPAYAAAGGTPAAATDLGLFYMPLDGLVDVPAERARLGKEAAKVEAEIAKATGKLTNPNFVERAKPEAVAKARADLADWEARKAQLAAMLAALP